MHVEGHKDTITAVGNIVAPASGKILEIYGDWKNHPQFGLQFDVALYKSLAPTSTVGIRRYLSGGLIQGIGPTIARRIVAKFGKDTLEVIDKFPERLAEVEGIGKHRIDVISKAWAEQKDVHSVMMFLHEHEISSAYASKIYKRYGSTAVEKVTDNPYRLAFDISGISFKVADKIAKSLGGSERSIQRATAGIIFVLREIGEIGHIFFPLNELLEKVKEKLNIENSILNEAMELLKDEGRIFVDILVKGDEKIEAVYLSDNHLAEVFIAEKLLSIHGKPPYIKNLYFDTSINYAQQKLQINMADKQKDAIKSAITNKITVITGGPGTGKTTITKAILEILSLVTTKILLAAPTGRAARRMFEATGYAAKTIHRLLEFNPVDCKFNRNEKRPLACDVLIIDEASMIDNSLAYHLLKAVPKTAVLIFIGDTDQLPSVGAGNVLKDIINSTVFPVIKLEEIFRQSQYSKIVTNAHRIINGESLEIENSSPDSDFYFINESNIDQVMEKIITIVRSRIPKKFGFSPVNDIQILSPMNRGNMGTIVLNRVFQDILNPSGTEVARAGHRLRVGDKVMQIRNNYDKNVYNGDMGIISSVDEENQLVNVRIDDTLKSYKYSELDELSLAYAISIHKSQGSEYPVVVIPITMDHYVMLQRNLIYTGITRGKRLVVVIGSPKALQIAVENNKVIERYTWLEQRLRGLYNEINAK